MSHTHDVHDARCGHPWYIAVVNTDLKYHNSLHTIPGFKITFSAYVKYIDFNTCLSAVNFRPWQ
jgi:hypothetical protein